MLIAAGTGRQGPPGKLPADVGCVVMNVTSVAFRARYLKTGMPLVEKRRTVDGSAVAHPKNVQVAIGTPVGEVIAFCGGTRFKVRKLLMGGPMMGLEMCIRDRARILRTRLVNTRGFLAFLGRFSRPVSNRIAAAAP